MFNGKIILLLLHKNFDFSENAVRNFNFILGYTIFTLILIVSKLLKRNLDEIFDFTQFHYYSIIFMQLYSYNYNSTHFTQLYSIITLIILKPALESRNFDLQSRLRKCFTKDFFSVEVLDLCYHLHHSYPHY